MAEQSELFQSALQQAAIAPAYRQMLKNDPKAALAAAGIEVDPDVEYVVLEPSEDKVYIILPPLQEADLLDKATEQMASVGHVISGRHDDKPLGLSAATRGHDDKPLGLGTATRGHDDKPLSFGAEAQGHDDKPI